MRIPYRAAGAVLFSAVALAAVPAAEEGTGWKDKAELSYVVTSGNAESSTIGFKNTLTRAWDRSAFTLKAGGIRVETTTTTREALGTPDDFTVDETDDSATTAENYYLNGRYDRKITDRFFWYAGGGWDRNRFAGVDNRYVATGGVGNIWFDTDDRKFRTDYAVTFTDQEDVVGGSESFVGARFSWEYLNKLGQNTEYENILVIDENLDDTSDLRADWTNAVAVSMNSRLALKVALQLLYDNEPSFVEVPLFSAPGVPAGETVLAELDDLDSIFTVALVINF